MSTLTAFLRGPASAQQSPSLVPVFMPRAPQPCATARAAKRARISQPHAGAVQELAAPAPSNQPPEAEKEFDVYPTPQPLEAGQEKHIISVFVADESGIINRVAGVFARRGANIESLAVGLNIDKALFTIEVSGTAQMVANWVKQLGKLIKVRSVEDITAHRRVERELVLVKVRAPPGQTRTEVMQVADIFRGRIVDVSDMSLTICATGDAGKTYAMQRTLAKFGILELARTGKICLKRGEDLLDMGGWGEGIVPRLRSAHVHEQPDDAAAAAASETSSSHGDVYDDSSMQPEGPGVWEVDNILQARSEGQADDFEAHTLSMVVADIPGVLNHVTAVFARRGYNVQSLAVGPCECIGCSRITMVVPGTPSGVMNLSRQLLKLIYVQKVDDLSLVPAVIREVMLVKVRCNAAQRRELIDIAEIFHGNVCDVSTSTCTLEMIGREDKMVAVQKVLAPYGILEIARTGRVALARESGVNTRFLGRMKSNAVNRPVY